jgi:hypothetical protein
LIWFGIKVALGACSFGDGEGGGGGDSCGLGAGDVDPSGVSLGDGDSERFFFWCDEAVGEGVGVSSSFAGVCFFFGEELGDGVGDSSVAGERFFFGDDDGVGVGVGDFFFVVVALFFFRCGVGVGVAKIFLSAWPSVSSAASLAGAATQMPMIKMRVRKSM